VFQGKTQLRIPATKTPSEYACALIFSLSQKKDDGLLFHDTRIRVPYLSLN
jgi:hypothetical protein